MALICFDIDGVIEQEEEKSEYVNGPVSLALIQHLSFSGHTIVMVSPSPYAPKFTMVSLNKTTERYFRVSDFGSNESRHKNLLKSKKMYPVADNLYLYISDNGDYKEAEKAGFVYVDALMFSKMTW